MEWSTIAAVLAVAIVVERMLEAIGEPVCALIGEVNPNVKRLVYIVIGAGLGWTTGLNAFPAFARYPIVGYIVSAVLVGAGSQVIHLVINALAAKDNQIEPPA